MYLKYLLILVILISPVFATSTIEVVDRYEQDAIVKLGASEKQTLIIMEAARTNEVSPIVLASLIFTESSFKKVKHSEPGVIGLCGINTNIWTNICPYNPTTNKGNIYASAWILKHYLKKGKGDYRKAITYYKGWSKKGKRQAKNVLKISTACYQSIAMAKLSNQFFALKEVTHYEKDLLL